MNSVCLRNSLLACNANLYVNLFFQESKFGIYHKLWKKMLGFQNNGKPVASPDHSLQLQMVDQGGNPCSYLEPGCP